MKLSEVLLFFVSFPYLLFKSHLVSSCRREPLLAVLTLVNCIGALLAVLDCWFSLLVNVAVSAPA
jgi:hypothetical protein